jgi:3-oxosteroid 1-dehydrogenase
MTGEWDHSVDLLIAGSGGGGLVAALAAIDSGIEPLIVEKQQLVGGSTGLSGGIVWLPDNPLMRADGIVDSHQDGLAYLADVVGEIGAASSPARREMFLSAGAEMTTFLLRRGLRLVRCDGWSDYYPNHAGGNAAGRGYEGMPFDAAELGTWSDKVQPSFAKSFGFVVRTNELRGVQYFNRSRQAFAVALRVFLRTAAARIRRKDLLTNGASIIGQMLKVLIELGGGEPPIWTNTALDELIVEDGRVVGARVVRDGTAHNVEARRGVLLAAGGFGRNAEMRRRYSGDQPNEARWTIANAGDTGEVLKMAMRLGARTDLLDEAWWLPMVLIPDGGNAAASLGSGRQRPGAIYVDSTGRRFCNESNSYVEVGKAMYANKAVPCWMVFDEGHVRRYVTGAGPLKRGLPRELIDRGHVKRGGTVADLARQLELPAAELERTVQRFNRFAALGLDPDFGRGQSAYNDCLGDPGYRPNAAIGPLDRSPYYAVQVHPADVGTCGGVLTNEYGQVLGQHHTLIEGLYATGNTTATVMGRTYPGAGASIANTMVFGYVAARHAAGRRVAGTHRGVSDDQGTVRRGPQFPNSDARI